MGESRIYPRDCFACGKPMIPESNISKYLVCRDCDIREDGTVKGRFHLTPIPFTWGDGDYIPFIDHSKVHLPSPDVIGSVLGGYGR